MKYAIDATARRNWDVYYTVSDIEKMVERDRLDNPEAGIIIENGIITGYVI